MIRHGSQAQRHGIDASGSAWGQSACGWISAPASREPARHTPPRPRRAISGRGRGARQLRGRLCRQSRPAGDSPDHYPRPTVCTGLPLSDLHPTPGLMPYPQLWYGRRISSSLPTPPCNFLSKTVGYCWPTYIKVLGVLCLGEVSSTFLPSKKACWAHQFQYLGVGQQYPVVCEPQRRALNFPQSWLRVFQRGNAAHLPHGVGQEREATLLQSEKYVARGGSKYDAMCMITASFVRLLQRCTDSLGMHFLLIFQEVRSVSKTRGGGRQKMANLAGKK